MMLGSGEPGVASSPTEGTAGPLTAGTTKASRSARPMSPGRNSAFELQLKRLLETPEGSAERVEGYMNLLNVSRQTSETDVPLFFNLPDFVSLLSTVSQDIQKEGQADVTHSAIRCSGFFCHYGDQAPPSLSQSFLDVLNAVLGRGRAAKLSEDKVTLTLCIWFLGAQRLLAKQIKSAISPIMELLFYGIETPVRSITICAEACTALTTIFAQSRSSILSQTKAWALPALMHLVHPEETVQSRAEALFQVILVDEKPGAIDKNVLDDFVKNAPAKFVPDLEKLSDDRALRAWRTAVAVCGASMHRTTTLNVFLKIIEKFFNSKDETVKRGAYDAWIYLIYSFAIGDHLLNEKRLALILTPYLECLRNRREPVATKMNVIRSWISLLYVVGASTPKFAQKLLFEIFSMTARCDSAVEASAYEVFDKLLEVPSGAYKAPGSPDIRRLLNEEQIQLSDLAPMDPKFVRGNVVQFAKLLVPLLSRDSSSSPLLVKPMAEHFWKTLLDNLAAQARLELNMGTEMQTAVDSLVQFTISEFQLPNKPPLTLLQIQSHFMGMMLEVFPSRILTARTKSEPFGKKSNEILERLLLTDSSGAPNWPRIRYSPLLSITKSWVSMPDSSGEGGELVLLELFGKILDIVAASSSVELYLSLLVAVEECCAAPRRLSFWAALATTFTRQMQGAEDVFSDENTFYEALGTLLMPVRHADSYSETYGSTWQDFWQALWDAARVKLRTPSSVLELLLEKVAVADFDGPASFEWAAVCYRSLFATASKDVAGLLSSTRKKSPGALLAKTFFSILETATSASAPETALSTAAELCTMTFTEMPELLIDSRFHALDTLEKFFGDKSGVSHEQLEELVKVLTQAYEKTGVSDSRERLHELGAIIKLVVKTAGVRPKIGSTLQHVLSDASKVQDVPLWLRNTFSKLSDVGSQDADEFNADELLMSSKNQARFSLAPKIQAAKGSDPVEKPTPEPWKPLAQADTQDFVPIEPKPETPSKRFTSDDNDSQEERRRKRKASIPALYNSLDQSQEAPMPEIPVAPMSETKRRRVEESPGSGDREDALAEMPTSPTSSRNSQSFDTQKRAMLGEAQSPIASRNILDEPTQPIEEPPDVVVDYAEGAAAAEPSTGEKLTELVDKLYDLRDNLGLLDRKSLALLHKRLFSFTGMVGEELHEKAFA